MRDDEILQTTVTMARQAAHPDQTISDFTVQTKFIAQHTTN
jgi:hypothetical protein